MVQDFWTIKSRTLLLHQIDLALSIPAFAGWKVHLFAKWQAFRPTILCRNDCGEQGSGGPQGPFDMAIISDMDEKEIPDSHNKIQHLVVSKSFQSVLCVNFCQLNLLNDFASVRLHCWICQDFWCDEYGSQTMVRCPRPSHSNTLPELYEYGWITSWKLRLPEKDHMISHVYTVYIYIYIYIHIPT